MSLAALSRHSKRLLLAVAALFAAAALLTTTGCAGCSQESGESSSTEASSASTETVEMPSVVGLTQDAAIEKLEKLGLTADVQTQSVDDDNQIGVVTAQDPEEDTALAEGDTVTITVGQQASSRAASSSESGSAASSSASASSTAASSNGTSSNAASNHMAAKDTDYDASTLPSEYRAYYDAGADALASNDYQALAKNVAALYPEYPNAAQSLVNSAKSQSWFSQFKKRLLKQDADAENILDLDR